MMTHGFIANYLGEYQSELNVPALRMSEEVRGEPPYVTNSDGYVEFVRHKKIDVIQGRMDTFSQERNTITVCLAVSFILEILANFYSLSTETESQRQSPI
jgi:hypothetical protein